MTLVNEVEVCVLFRFFTLRELVKRCPYSQKVFLLSQRHLRTGEVFVKTLG